MENKHVRFKPFMLGFFIERDLTRSPFVGYSKYKSFNKFDKHVVIGSIYGSKKVKIVNLISFMRGAFREEGIGDLQL